MNRTVRNLLVRLGLAWAPAHALAFLLTHLAIGLIGALAFGGLVLWMDLGGLGELVTRSGSPGVAVFLLFFGLFVTFGGIAMAIGIMGMGEERD